MDERRAQRADDPATQTYEHAVRVYVVTEQDVAGPFLDEVPSDLAQQASLPALSYVSPLEMLAERFHVHPELLLRMNPGVTISPSEAETEVQVRRESFAATSSRSATSPLYSV